MDEDDRAGYLLDYVLSWAGGLNITCGEDVGQRDDVQLALPDFADEVLKLAGVYE